MKVVVVEKGRGALGYMYIWRRVNMILCSFEIRSISWKRSRKLLRLHRGYMYV